MIQDALNGWILEAVAVPTLDGRWGAQLLLAKGDQPRLYFVLGASGITADDAERAAIRDAKRWIILHANSGVSPVSPPDSQMRPRPLG